MMKKRYVMLIAVLTAGLLIGCTKGKTSETEKTDADKTEEADETSNDAGNSADDLTDLSMQSQRMYEAFLEGEEKLYFDSCQCFYDADLYNLDRFQGQDGYTLDEFSEAYQLTKDDEEEMQLTDISYQFVDCASDEVKELVLQVGKTDSIGIGYDDVYVIKNIEGKLQAKYLFNYGYRTYGEITEKGIVRIGGSSSATSYGTEYILLDADCNEKYLYNMDSDFDFEKGIYTFNDIDYSDYEDIVTNMSVDAYTFEQYDTSEESEDYFNSYMKRIKYVYYVLDENGNVLEDSSVYEEGSQYAKLAAATGCDFYKPDEMEKITDEICKENGITKEMLNDEAVSFTTIKEFETADNAENENVEDEKTYVVENPSWTYYTTQTDVVHSKISLTETAKESNDIIDEDDWFAKVGASYIDRADFSDGQYGYSTFGDEFDPTFLTIQELSGESVATLDLSLHQMPDEYKASDEEFIRESPRFAKAVDGILYISIGHTTYAESAAHNAYIMALDMNDDYKLIWKSEPLTSNARNFEIVDDTIICGYGFTKEDDYIYLLNRYTGEREDAIRVKSGPDYFHVDGDKLYVRTYDTDYEFDIKHE